MFIQLYSIRKRQHHFFMMLFLSFNDNIYNNVKFRANNRRNSIEFYRQNSASINLLIINKHKTNKQNKQSQIKIAIVLNQKIEKIEKISN